MTGCYIIDVGVSRILGSRKDQEDRYLTRVPGSIKSRKELAFFAVCDGHGGAETVNHVSDNLVTHLEQNLPKAKDSTPETYQDAIQRALTSVDRELGRGDLDGGSTVTLVLIDTKQGILIHGNLGDSHVVYTYFSPQPPSPTLGSGSTGSDPVDNDSSAAWSVEALSVEHSPESPAEKKRIEAAGGEVNYETGIARIGAVNVSRGLGDLDYKIPRVNRLAGHDLSDLPGMATGLAPGKRATQDLVSSKAQFETRHLHGQSLVLLASDGVGDSKAAKEATWLAVDRWMRGTPAALIAEELTKREDKVQGADNCTVLIVAIDTDKKAKRRKSDSMRGSLEMTSTDGSGSRHRRRSSLSRLADWILD